MPTQATLGRSVRLRGRSYFSGETVQVELQPAPPDHGIVFERTDCRPSVSIPARIQHRVADLRRTTLAVRSVRVAMVEHIMATFAGMGIDNVRVALDGPEMPAFDGSSLPFVEAVEKAGIVDQNVPARTITIAAPVRVGDANRWIEALPAAHGQWGLRYELEYAGEPSIGRQMLHYTVDRATFGKAIAPARSFLLESEARELRAMGIGRHVTYRDVLVFGKHGPIENTLRFEDECVRHKMLDLIGDLGLCGARLRGTIVAHRTGHERNAAMVAAIVGQAESLRDSQIA